MLARLDQDLAPLRASVNREGSVLRVEGPGDQAEVGPRVTRIVEQMGYVAAPIETPSQVSRWFGSDDVDELSREEARILVQRWVGEIEAEDVIEDPERLRAPLQSALFEAFRSAARTGSIDSVRIDAAAFKGVLVEWEAERVRSWIEAKLIGHRP